MENRAYMGFFSFHCAQFRCAFLFFCHLDFPSTCNTSTRAFNMASDSEPSMTARFSSMLGLVDLEALRAARKNVAAAGLNCGTLKISIHAADSIGADMAQVCK